MSPIQSSSFDPEPIGQALARRETYPRKAPHRTSFEGVSVNLREIPEAYSRHVEPSGNALVHPHFRLGATDLLNAIVSG